jgi:hypothetical protein
LSELYNLTGIFDAPNPLVMLEEINMITNGTMGAGLYIVIAVGVLVAMFFSTRDAIETFAIGGLVVGILGIPLALLGIIPIFMPFIFFSLSVFAVVMRLISK